MPTSYVTFTKDSARQLRETVIQSNTAQILATVNTKSLLVKGSQVIQDEFDSSYGLRWWTQKPGPNDEGWQYTLLLRIDQEKEDKIDLDRILVTLSKAAAQNVNGRWNIDQVNGKGYVAPPEGAEGIDAGVGYAPVSIPDNFEEHFSHLYGLESHVNRVRRAIQAGIDSEWANRYNVQLAGPPGCGKSDLARSLKAALGEDAVMEFDATATTAAGFIKEMATRQILPRIVIVEEIEKAVPASLQPFMAVCDLRGEIRKTTAREAIQRDVKLLVIATVNNTDLFDDMLSGALSSRFSNKIFFKRPTRALLAKILDREIAKVNGDTDWIVPCLNYCEANKIDDPRIITAHCLCGADGWLDGSYEQELADTAYMPEGEDFELS